MKTTLAALAILLAPMIINAQEKPEWHRVYTFEESVIEMNTQLVSFSGKSTGRVRFRWNFEKPQRWGAKDGVEYSSRLEVVEFDCKEKRYRHSALTLFDGSGKTLHTEEMDWFGPWSPVYDQSFIKRLYEPACRLLELRRHPPKPGEPAEREKKKGSSRAGTVRPALVIRPDKSLPTESSRPRLKRVS